MRESKAESCERELSCARLAHPDLKFLSSLRRRAQGDRSGRAYSAFLAAREVAVLLHAVGGATRRFARRLPVRIFELEGGARRAPLFQIARSARSVARSAVGRAHSRKGGVHADVATRPRRPFGSLRLRSFHLITCPFRSRCHRKKNGISCCELLSVFGARRASVSDNPPPCAPRPTYTSARSLREARWRCSARPFWPNTLTLGAKGR